MSEYDSDDDFYCDYISASDELSEAYNNLHNLSLYSVGVLQYIHETLITDIKWMQDAFTEVEKPIKKKNRT